MTEQDRMVLLKKDLQMTTSANDVLLTALLQFAEKSIIREGIVIEADNIECDMVIIQYAAFLFRKRAANTAETGMPRFLRYALNNLLLSQKARAGESG